MRVVIRKWGNSASVRIPSAVMAAARLDIDAVVDVSEEDGKIIIEPLRKPSVDLNALIARMTPENLHEEADFGEPQGKEAL
ncbi:AbrB/MazE/SpoVT family DNA-binding domain-containing protein [Neorhizobium lilium]|uniref:AbrB/MazE/SpoVT family DNA-binding domain-containing protein n=1 Tax=Neorhizobium lilium TaxID=2503024 RepID=A0A444LJ81_9HYPH|nr:AbrB/MazE/SpoVT family DNA-binding domain-containing protein [Neorhizobium lilium]RWX79078.1 AbrB/MazE/SpoVT family DNA-binding domain-containing protein [Neorhizobium lilium]